MVGGPGATGGDPPPPPPQAVININPSKLKDMIRSKVSYDMVPMARFLIHQ